VREGAVFSGAKKAQCDFHSAPYSIHFKIIAFSLGLSESFESGVGIIFSGSSD